MATTDLPSTELPTTDLPSTDLPSNEFTDVPAADADSAVDPHWLELRGSSGLPTAYLPPAMSSHRPRPPWLRGVAAVLVVVFLTATAAGVCLTYGPSHLWH